MNDWSRVPKLVPSRQLARDILKTGKKLLETIEQQRVNLKENGPKTSRHDTAIYNAAIELSGLLNPRKYPFDVFRETVLNAIGWPPELVQGLREIQSAVCSIRRECNWVNDPIPKPSDPPTNVNDIEHDPFECTICIFPQLRKAISNIHTSKINEGLGFLQKALASVEHLPPTADEWIESTKIKQGDVNDVAVPPQGAIQNSGPWSKPIPMKDLRYALGISQNTLKTRLTDSQTPIPGMIRYRGKPNARKIECIITDLPTATHDKLRRFLR